MPKHDDDLFTRLRRAGVRKPVAKTLSELSGDAGKKATSAGHKTVAELRALADEIEKRLPAPASKTVTPNLPAPATPARRRAAAPATPARRRAAAPQTPTDSEKTAPRRRATATSAATPSATAPRGENKAKILAALTLGPRTASEIGQETGIATATVSAALTRLAKAGEVTKATRGYTLPS